jgi:hypothetical protein
MRRRQATLSPLLIPFSPLLIGLSVHIKHNAGDMRRWVVLNVTEGQRSCLRADMQTLRRIVGAVGAEGETFDKGSGVKRWFYHRTPRLLAVMACLM